MNVMIILIIVRWFISSKINNQQA